MLGQPETLITALENQADDMLLEVVLVSARPNTYFPTLLRRKMPIGMSNELAIHITLIEISFGHMDEVIIRRRKGLIRLSFVCGVHQRRVEHHCRSGRLTLTLLFIMVHYLSIGGPCERVSVLIGGLMRVP